MIMITFAHALAISDDGTSLPVGTLCSYSDRVVIATMLGV